MGSIDISKVWPDGHDEIVALAAHNNLLIIFGKRSIVVYNGADAPATGPATIGVGCVGRDTVQYTGVDVIFLDRQNKELWQDDTRSPISNLSGTITKDIMQRVLKPTNSLSLCTTQKKTFIY